MFVMGLWKLVPESWGRALRTGSNCSISRGNLARILEAANHADRALGEG